MSWKRRAGKALGIIVLILIAAAAWMLGPALLPPEDSPLGIKAGAKAPVEMPLRDSTGAPATLAGAMGEQGMVLTLMRSADWCPFCKAQLGRLEERRAEIEGMGWRMAVLTYDKPETLAEFAASHGTGMALFSDEGSRFIDAVGLRDPQYGKDSFAHGVALASTLVIARDGTVKARFVSADYRSRIDEDDIVAMVRAAR